MKPEKLYVHALIGGLVVAMIWGVNGFTAFTAETVDVFARILEAVVAIAIIAEAYASGFGTSTHFWRSVRMIKMSTVLIVGVTLTGLVSFWIAKSLGMHNPLGVAAGLMATDPAAVGLALGLVQGNHLLGIFWSLTVESLLNDAIGISVYGVAVGQTLTEAFKVVTNTLLVATGLGLAQTMVRFVIRKVKNDSALLEVDSIMLTYLVFVAFGYHEHLSLILLTAVGSMLADAFGEFLPNLPHEVEHELHDQWERLNQFGLAVILIIVTFLAPVKIIFGDGRILGAGVALLTGIVVSRAVMDLGKRAVCRVIVTGRWGHQYGLEAGIVTWLAGSTRLGVPSIVALHLAGEGDVFAASAMFATVLLSMLFIPLAVGAIQHVERHFAEGKGNWPSGRRERDEFFTSPVELD